MNLEERTLTFEIGLDGKLYIHEKDIYAEILTNQDNRGRRGIMTIQFLGKEKSQQLLGYYWGVVVKDVQKYMYDKGECMTGRQIDEMLREQVILTSDIAYTLLGEELEKVKRISDLDNKTLAEFIYQVKIWAAENLNLYIKDPIA
jgi:hypothetical protein